MLAAKPDSIHPAGDPRDLGSLMAVYECIYIRLRRLIPDLESVGSGAVSSIPGGLDLHLRVIERTRYTTLLHLTYRLPGEEGMVIAPDVRVRMFHDARLAEVLSCGRKRRGQRAEYEVGRTRYSLARKWEMNRFLQKWLGYCLRQGHRLNLSSPACRLDSAASDSELVNRSTPEVDFEP